MKWNSFAVLISLTLLSIKLNAQQVSFSGNAVQPESFFSSVSKQTGYVFFYNTTVLGNIPSLNIQLKNVSLDSAMHSVLKNQPITWSIQGKTIFITPAKTSSTESSAEQFSNIQKINGRVIDQSGLPVIGATVFEPRLKTYTVSNENGEFEISISKEDSLMISSIGYSKVVVKPESIFTVTVLRTNASPLEQVVVGGNLFATKRKSDISSLTIIDSKTLQTLPVTDISEIYRGLVPGTNSFNVGDQPQGLPTLTIRGAGSETSLSEIGVYIDGVEWAGGSGYLSTLNIENIDRIEVLRGPESSTLYGTGSNGGLVQIYTKKGTSNSNELTATAGAGFINSKWAPASAFQQYYTLGKQISFKKSSLLAGATYQTNGAWLPGGGEKTGTAHLNFKWDPVKKFSMVLSGYYAGTDRGISRLPVFDTCTHVPDTLQNFGVYPRN